jgi:hypothetical protein
MAQWSPVGGSQPPNDRSALGLVLGVLAALALIGGALIIVFSAESDDSGPPLFNTSGIPTFAAPTTGQRGSGPVSTATVPSPDPTALPTGDGPTEEDYVAVASKVVRAARRGDCPAARALTDDIFDTAVSDANLCQGFARRALREDDLRDYAITFFGNYGAAVEFDEGRTYLSLVATADGPLVEVLIAY